MFWGCFAGGRKGPGLFWEKSWGSINNETYTERVVPLIDEWIRLNRMEGEELVLMQDGAPAHSAAATRQALEQRGVTIIYWPPYSPDLNPIEMCWNWMKDYIQDKWGVDEHPTYPRLRRYVQEAWQELSESFIQELLDTMHNRCVAVIEVNGMHTRY